MYSYNARRGQFPRTRIGIVRRKIVMQYAPRVLHFSAFHCCLCVCVCVCLSVKSHLTYGASVGPENAVTHSAANEGQNISGDFPETAAF